MNGFLKVTQALNTQLKAKGFRVVTLGDNFKVDLVRQTIFPYAHIVPLTAPKDKKVTQWEFEIIGMDLVDFNKDDPRNLAQPFYTTDNMQDVLNDIHNRLSQVAEEFERGSEFDNLMQVNTPLTFGAFMERYENMLAGWSMGIIIDAPNNISIC